MPLSTIMSVMTPSSSTATLVQSNLGSSANGTHAGSHVHGPSVASNNGNVSVGGVGGSVSNTSSTSNPVSALMAGRTTLVAPPSLSTVNHSDTLAGNRARERVHRLTGRSTHASVRSDLQQALSPPTAAVPVSTRENISTSQRWSIPPTKLGPQKPPLLSGTNADAVAGSEEFQVHPTFAKEAEQRGDVLVRVEGVEFYVHKHVLMFSSPFFASLLEGEWKESQLAGHVDDSETSSMVQPDSADETVDGMHPRAGRSTGDGEDDDDDEDKQEEVEILADDNTEAEANDGGDESAAPPRSWQGGQARGGDEGAVADGDDADSDADGPLLSPLSEMASGSSLGDDLTGDGRRNPARSSTVRASYYTAEYHFDESDEAAGGGSGSGGEGSGNSSDEGRQHRIADAQRALEGELARGGDGTRTDTLSEPSADSKQPATSRKPETAEPPSSAPSRSGDSEGFTGTTSSGDAGQVAAAGPLSRRRSASLDSSHPALAPLRSHKPKSRSIAVQRKASRRVGEDAGSRTIPARKSSKSFDLSAMSQAQPGLARQHDSEPASPLTRFESLATPPGSPGPKTLLAASSSEGAPMASASAVAPPPRSLASTETHVPRRRAKERSRRTGARAHDKLIAVVDLEEETASTFQSFLFHIYPHLDLHVTWFNCGPLLRFADKFQVPYMRRICVMFLKTALPGRPIEAMRIAEQHQLPEQYKEASRHVLDNYSEWYPEELECLSKETLLKLERKRTWFLERMLKLGLCSPARDYECHAQCPDPQGCARLLQEKWQAAYANAFRFSPPQPSAIFRHLRDLDGAPFLAMSACQNTARAWVRLLFDRMFSLDTLHTPRQFLFVRLEAQVVKGKEA
ncbi:hypothetical protein ACQY0O_007733 [Thecaphora frezii]